MLMDKSALLISASMWGKEQTIVLDRAPHMVLNGRKLACPSGRVFAERSPDTWQSQRGWHGRIVIQGEVMLRFEAPAYQFDMDERFDEVSLVGDTLWNHDQQLIAFYDAATGRWRDADSQQWTAIHIVARTAPAEQSN